MYRQGLIHQSCIRVTRMQRLLYRRLFALDGKVGCVGPLYQSGFDIELNSGGRVYFQHAPLLLAPFSAVLDRPIRPWLEVIDLREGEAVYKKGMDLFRANQSDVFIHLDPLEIIDLPRCILPAPPREEELARWILFLGKEVCNAGCFDGIGGLLLLLQGESPVVLSGVPLPLNLWSERAIPVLRRSLDALRRGDRDWFGMLWSSLLGLGPGLTPSGDDFLIGFLAAHHLLSSPVLAVGETGPGMGEELVEEAGRRTNKVGCQFLEYALKGIYSENIHHLFNVLQRSPHGEREKAAVAELLKSGHTSGTDTMIGVVFGLLTLMIKR